MTEPGEKKFNGDIESGLPAYIRSLLEIADASLTSPILNKDTPVKKTKNKKRNDLYSKKDEPESIEEQAKNLRMGKHHVEFYAPNLITVIKTISDLGRPSVSEYGLECLRNVLAGAFLIGSRGVVTEGAKEFYRPEIESEVRSNHGGPGGEESGRVRRLDADEGWRPHALELAKEITAEPPWKSQQDIAAEIPRRWRLRGFNCPKSQLIEAISKWEKSGELPSRGRKSDAIK